MLPFKNEVKVESSAFFDVSAAKKCKQLIKF